MLSSRRQRRFKNSHEWRSNKFARKFLPQKHEQPSRKTRCKKNGSSSGSPLPTHTMLAERRPPERRRAPLKQRQACPSYPRQRAIRKKSNRTSFGKSTVKCFAKTRNFPKPHGCCGSHARHGGRKNWRVAPSRTLVFRKRNRPRAETSDRTRKPLMQELALAGLVRWERERIRRVLKDRMTGHLRMRCVSGRTKYVVLKSPHKDWFSHTTAQKSPHKHWPSSKVKFSPPLESCNTPNKTDGHNHESPHKHWASLQVQSLHGARITPASTFSNPPRGEVWVFQRSRECPSMERLLAAPRPLPESDIRKVEINHSPSSSVSGTATVKRPMMISGIFLLDANCF